MKQPNRQYRVISKDKKGPLEDRPECYLQLKYGKCVLKEIKVGSDAEGRKSAMDYLLGMKAQLEGNWTPRTTRDLEKARA
jgi:hypothetical protein